MSKITSKISSEITTMFDVFKDDDYNVPFYQRDYSWKKDEISDFWNDLMDVIDGEQDSHFFGQIVTYNHANTEDLIDGQQRVTTSAILMAVIHNISVELMDNDLNDNPRLELMDVQKQISNAIRYNEITPALTLQPISKKDNSIHEYFIGLFGNRIDIDPSHKDIAPIKNINEAYLQLKIIIDSYVKHDKTINERIENLKLVFESFFNKFYVSMISTPNSQDAFVIFETLNSRGKDLEPAEIIKTHIMSQLSSEDTESQKEFQDNWNKVANELDKKSDKLTSFIRIYWAASHRLVSARQLYRSISSNINTENDAKNFINDLDNLVHMYKIVDNIQHTKEEQSFIGNKDLLDIVTLLRRMQVKLYYPILFAMYRRGFSTDNLKVVLYKVLCVFIRHRTICNDGTNKLETGYASIAKDIWNQSLTNTEDINKKLSDNLLKNDNEIEASFQALRKDYASKGAKHWILYYLLFNLYQETYGDFDDQLFSEIDIHKYSVIHIGDLDEIEPNYWDYIGNYALIEKNLSVNNSLGVDVALRMSKLNGNQNIGNFILENGWNIDDIVNRQKQFGNSSTYIW